MKKILIVDDSVALLEVMKNILERNDYTIRTLNTATNIYTTIDEFQPDLLILDIYLAGSDGREICRHLRENPITHNLCILVFSASPKTLEDYKSYHADDFIEKPFDITYLVEKIKLVLKNCQSKPASVIA
ncbi:MAG: response regulator [Ginsengibacter sp.]